MITSAVIPGKGSITNVFLKKVYAEKVRIRKTAIRGILPVFHVRIITPKSAIMRAAVSYNLIFSLSIKIPEHIMTIGVIYWPRLASTSCSEYAA